MSSIDFHVNERAAAAQRLHWHLSRAASIVMQGLELGRSFDEEMALAERARADWRYAQNAIMGAEPDHGSGGGSGGDN